MSTWDEARWLSDEEARMSLLNWCECSHPVIRCDHRGCHCTHCGGAERPRFARERELRKTHPLPELPAWMSRSYPYLSIARRFGLDYGLVLQNASSGDLVVLPDDAPDEASEAIWAAQELHRYMCAPDRPEENFAEVLEKLGPGPVDALWGNDP